MKRRPKPKDAVVPRTISRKDTALRQGEISLHMSHFCLGYLREIYRHFEGDLALVIVLGEIAHHNLSGHFSPPWTDREALRSFESGPASLAQLPSCNAFSLAASTGLPRETIRRKIARLEELGWIARTDGRELRITPEVAGHFTPDFNVRLMENLLATAERIREVLALEKASGR